MADIAGFGVCNNNHEDCFAYMRGRCRILHDADFHGKDCHFYKEKSEHEKELGIYNPDTKRRKKNG